MNDQLHIEANVTVYDRDGNVLCEGRNTVTDAGATVVTRMLFNDGAEFSEGFNYAELGTDSTPPNTSDVALEAPIIRAEVQASSKRRTDNTISVDVFFFGATLGMYIREAGLYIGDDGSSATGSGTLFARVALNIDNSLAVKDLVLSWQLRIAPA